MHGSKTFDTYGAQRSYFPSESGSVHSPPPTLLEGYSINSDWFFCIREIQSDCRLSDSSLWFLPCKKNVPELKNGERQAACLKWVLLRENQLVDNLGYYFRLQFWLLHGLCIFETLFLGK